MSLINFYNNNSNFLNFRFFNYNLQSNFYKEIKKTNLIFNKDSNLSSRNEWNGKRFGNIPKEILGEQNQIKKMNWPDLEYSFTLLNKQILFKKINNIEEESNRISEIFKNSSDETIGNIDDDWVLNPKLIIKKLKFEELKYYGIYINNLLSGCILLQRKEGSQILVWHFGVIEPNSRKLGLWKHFGKYLDQITKLSNAHIAEGHAYTTHPYSQILLEKNGFKPYGFYPGSQFNGGSDGKFYRSSVICYFKMYGDALKYTLPNKNLILTESASLVVNSLENIWKK